ncbi:NnrS family protein [Tabrizicola sp.]|uniref:NnrS family protein n=1 Tax=Tabrizicola sp. TaxID=2005166 RepID=UPI001A412DB0|nr:NnrS family protein [Tabrizicola sp.]MBL9072863.1 NnrS family protein [Tabrizicola sp.]
MTPLKRLFGDGFRVFFLAAGLFALFSMGVWEGYQIVQALGITLDLPTAAPPHLWHAHEMIFGYGSAALGGFLLTAVPNWTGAKSAPHRFIAVAAGLWLAGRLTIWTSGALPPALVAVLDLAFVPVLASNLLTQLIKRPKPQQMIILAILTAFWVANLMVHLEWTGLTTDTAWAGLRAGLLTLGALIMVLGGRVTPGFTRNAMVQSGREHGLPVNPMPLAGIAIAAALTQPLGYLVGAPEPLLAPFALIAGTAGLIRVALWRGLWTRDKPILWTLHLSSALNALGFFTLGLADLGLASDIAALHLLGIGGVGGMTLAIMSRATLGHTGRALVAPRPVALAYALIPLAALTRCLGAEMPFLAAPAVLTAGALWLVAFGLFTVALWPVFWGPRASRSPAGTAPS